MELMNHEGDLYTSTVSSGLSVDTDCGCLRVVDCLYLYYEKSNLNVVIPAYCLPFNKQ